MRQPPAPPAKSRCPLCGAATHGAYCHAHSWAAGTRPVIKPILELVRQKESA